MYLERGEIKEGFESGSVHGDYSIGLASFPKDLRLDGIRCRKSYIRRFVVTICGFGSHIMMPTGKLMLFSPRMLVAGDGQRTELSSDQQTLCRR